MKKFFLIFLFLLSISKGSETTNLKIHVNLWPAGDFVAVSKVIKGKVYKKGGKYFGENIKVPVKSIDTGIELRNTHLQERLGADKDSNASIVLLKGNGENGKGEATFLINGIKQTFPISYKEISPNFIEAEFDIDFSKFKIPNLKYMGVGVQDIGKVVVTIPLEEKK